jgi:hypothetical protein
MLIFYSAHLCCFCLEGLREARITPSKAFPISGRGGLYGCKILRILHCLDSRLIDGGKVVSFTHRPHHSPQKHFFCFWYSLLLDSLLLSFWTLSIVRISTNRKHDVSETGSVSVFRRGGGTYSIEKPKACLSTGDARIACGKASFWFFCRVGPHPPRLKTETDPVSETLCFLFVEIRTMDKVQKLSSNECIFLYMVHLQKLLNRIITK